MVNLIFSNVAHHVSNPLPNVGGQGSFHLVRIGLLASKEENAVVFESHLFRDGSQESHQAVKSEGLVGCLSCNFEVSLKD